VKYQKLIIAAAILIVIGAVGFAVVRMFWVKAIRVPTGAMANTIVPGDYLIAYRLFGAVKRGDVVVFQYPNEPSTRYVSRVIGLPGETIRTIGTEVLINDQPIPEQRVFVKYPYDFQLGVLEELSTEGSGPYRVFYFKKGEEVMPTVSRDMKFAVAEPFRIPDNQYFLMSDNRDNSFDSRHKGPVPRELIWGRPNTIYWSSHADQFHQEKVKWERIGKEIK